LAGSFMLSTAQENEHPMKLILATTCFVIGTALMPVAAHAGDSDVDRQHVGTYVKDSAITAKVKAKLAEEKLGTLARVRVDTDNKGVVVLSGTVRSQEESDEAASIARATEGVTSIVNHLRIKKDD